LFKVTEILTHAYYKLVELYLTDRLFQIIFKDEITTLRKIEAGIPQGRVLGPVLYFIYRSDLPTSDSSTTATFTGDTAILDTYVVPAIASMQLQVTIDKVDDWAKKLIIKILANQRKSMHISFTLRNDICPTVQIGTVDLPQKNNVKYLNMLLDRRLEWAKHIRTKRKQLS
jgi:hypothetical protein